MFDLLIFTQHPGSYAPNRLREESEKIGINTKVLNYGKVDLNKLPESKAVILREPDFEKNIYKLRDEILNKYLLNKTKVLNEKSYSKWSVLDKITQHDEFKNADIPFIKTTKYEDLHYPYIVKSKLGSHGSYVFKINNKTDLDKVLASHKHEDLLFQEFQKSGFDLRIIVMDSIVLGIMRRTPKDGEFLSNYSQGGSVSIYDGNDIDIVSGIAVKAARHFNLDYVGVDLMKGNDDEWKVLEVNRACQFKGFEKATGVNIASELIKFLIRV